MNTNASSSFELAIALTFDKQVIAAATNIALITLLFFMVFIIYESETSNFLEKSYLLKKVHF